MANGLQELDSSQYQEISGLQELDPSQFQPLPSYADGSSPDSPINESPVEPMDRMKMSLGNEAGNIKYLKSKFDNVTKDKQGDLLVQNQGIWHRVDPNTFESSDPWEVTKKIVNKIPSATGTMMNITGAALGSAVGLVGGPAGVAIGAGAGASGAETLRTSLGRLAGTYEATPEQQAKDIAWESLLAAGGESIAAGVKPGLQHLGKSLSHIGDTATNFAKENLSALYGTLTDAGRWATRRAMDSAPSVIGKADKAIKSIGVGAARNEAIDVAAQVQNKIVSNLASESKTALQANFGKQKASILGQVDEHFVAPIGDMVKSVQQNLANAGYGKFSDTGKFSILTPSEVAERITSSVPGQETKIIGENTRAALEKLASLTNQYRNFPELKGRAGANKLMDLKRALNESFDEMFGQDVPKSIQRLAGQVKDDFSNKTTQIFTNHKPSLGQQYINMNMDYAAKKDVVDLFNDSVKNGQVDQLVKKLVSKAGSNRTLKDEAQHMAQLLGEKGSMRLNDVLDWEAAKGFVDFVPKSMSGNTGITIAKAAGTVIQQTNPRVVAKQIQYGSKALDFLKSMGPRQLKQLLSNDDAIASFITPLTQVYGGGEEQVAEQFLRESGVK